MATDAVEATFDGGIPNFTGGTGKDASRVYEKNLDIVAANIIHKLRGHQ
jgi:hypothetical protein